MINFNPMRLQRGTDILGVVICQKDTLASKANELAIEAISDFPNYPVDGVGATFVFQTGSGIYTLGGIRANNYITKEKTQLDIDFPSQISTTIGGKLMDPNKPLREATIDAIAYKMFYDRKAAQGPLKPFFDILESNEGWDPRVCVQTDKGDWGTMCYITSVKWMRCTDEYLSNLTKVLSDTMEQKKQDGAELRTLTDFKFQVLFPIVINAVESHFKTEVEKAMHAYYKDPTAISVTFNDLSVTALAKAGVFDGVGAQFIQVAFIIAEAVKQAFQVAEAVKKIKVQ